MIQKKICILGAYAVGKTSLVSRFSEDTFSERYTTTAGVKVGRREVQVDDRTLNMVLWDVAGEDSVSRVESAYFTGSAGYILVADITRRSTFEKAFRILQRAEKIAGERPFVFVLNKLDLTDSWDIDDDLVRALAQRNGVVIHTSARTGMGVEQTFHSLARKLIDS